ncbi:MAG TPA: recombinase family protein [Candidatus Limnocylindrales bacterium]|nr:recombinase family protein [Candidatus Limnocylindrales bacterium]
MSGPRVHAAYLRRSHVSEDRPGDASEEVQTEAVRRLCGSDVAIYKDWGISGRRADRPEYLRLKADIAAGKVASVCAYSLSRLGRSTRELLDFVELCKRHEVTLRTAVENLDTAGAMGRLLFTIMAAIGEFEAEVTAERMAGVQAERRARHEAAGALLPGGKMPNSLPMYGYRHARVNDASGRLVLMREPDPDRPIRPVVEAYREAGSLHGAIKLLHARGIPAPKGDVWHAATLARVLRSHDPDILPMRSATGRRRPLGKPAPFRGLLVCHCGALMTPVPARKAYRCSRGDSRLGTAIHGPAWVTERHLVEALEPEVDRIPVRVLVTLAGAQAAERDRLTEARRRLGIRYSAGELPDSEYLTELRRLDTKLGGLTDRSARVESFRLEHAIDLVNDDPAATNDALRRWWRAVRLDRDWTPSVDWLMDPDELERAEAEAEAAMRRR